MALPALPEVEAVLAELLAGLITKKEKIESDKGITLGGQDIINLVSQGIGGSLVALGVGLMTDLQNALETGEGPNEPPDIGLS